ncbi:MAG: hypothetical protein QM778_04545 [Myxococcales bacterium]
MFALQEPVIDIADPSIESLLRRLYAAISFEEGSEPDWSELEAVFSRHARITRITPEGTDYLDPSSFISFTRNMHEFGAYTSFYEVEIARRTERFGHMAQVWSMYETRSHRTAAGALNRGLNSIQLIRERDGWQVLGLLWDETHAHPQLDRSSLFSEGGEHGQG